MLPLNTIIVGDSRTVLPKIDSNSVNLVVTSPPYNFRRDYADYNDEAPWEEYWALMNDVFTEVYRILKDDGRLALVITDLYSEHYPTHYYFHSLLEEIGFKWWIEVVWDKQNVAKYVAFGSFASPSAPYFRIPHEYIMIYYKKTFKREDKGEADISPREFLDYTYGIWRVMPQTDMKKKWNHPAMFPEEIPYRLIKLLSYKEDIVLDPFNGVGTTTAVATRLNRYFIGIDISKTYCEIAYKRTLSEWSQTTLTHPHLPPKPRLIDLSAGLNPT